MQFIIYWYRNTMCRQANPDYCIIETICRQAIPGYYIIETQSAGKLFQIIEPLRHNLQTSSSSLLHNWVTHNLYAGKLFRSFGALLWKQFGSCKTMFRAITASNYLFSYSLCHQTSTVNNMASHHGKTTHWRWRHISTWSIS